MKAIPLAVALAFASSVHAADEIPTYDAGEIVVTPTRFKTARTETTTNVTVLTQKDIVQSGARTIPELLEAQTGIHTHNNDGSPDSSIDIRGFGMTGNQNTLVLLDGQRLNDIDLASVKWSTIPLDSIERIEIIRGSGSVLYGEGATGGVINIITKSPSKTKTGHVSLALGSYRTSDLQAGANFGSDNTRLRLDAADYESRGYRHNNQDRQQNLDGDLRLGSDHDHFGIRFGANDQTIGYPGVRRVIPASNINELESDPRGTLTPLDWAKLDGNHLGLYGTRKLGDIELAGDFGYRDKRQRADFVSQSSYLDTDINVLTMSPRVKLPIQAGNIRHTLIAGMDVANWDYDQIRATSPATVGAPSAHVLAKRKDRAIYFQDDMQWTPATLISIGARNQSVTYNAKDTVNTASYASNSQSRNVRAYEIGARHELTATTALFGKIGRSFRIATVDEIYNQYGSPVYDSLITMLEPQTSNDREIGVDYNHQTTHLRATFYHMDLRNEIHYNAITFTNMNLSPTRRYGLELEGKWQLAKTLTGFANYTYTEAIFREGVYNGVNVAGNHIPVVPRHTLTFGGTWHVTPNTRLNTTVNYVGSQYFDNDQTNNFGQKMPAYTTVDVKLNHEIGNWTLSGAVNNLFNEKYYTYGIRSTSTPGRYNAYPMPDRNFMFTAAYAFK